MDPATIIMITNLIAIARELITIWRQPEMSDEEKAAKIAELDRRMAVAEAWLETYQPLPAEPEQP